ncbi:MAG TPA: MlaD family protein [Solirubrobacterales bacterium]|nr:MlaD family protein [Solirubrobacterales bacterium]
MSPDAAADLAPQRRYTLVRVLAVGALLAALAWVIVMFFGDDGGRQYKLIFQTGGQLVPGNQVMVGGQPVGSIDSIDLTDDAQAEVTVSMEEPILAGSTAQIRLTSLSGIANRYIALHPGPDSDEELPDGATLSADETTSPVDLDQLFNTFDDKTRKGLQQFISGQATVYTGNTAAARETYKYFAPSLEEGERLLAEINEDDAALSRFLVEGGEVFGALADRREDLSGFIQNANQALSAIAVENEAFSGALAALPPAMRQANTTFVNLRAALDDIDPLMVDLGRVAPDLPQFLRDLRPVARDARPVLADLTTAISKPGNANDLTDSLRDLPAVDRAAQTAVPATVDALADSQHIFEFARPYSPDLVALLSRLGSGAGYYDFNGHYIRAQVAGSNIFNYNAGTEELDPIGISQVNDAYSGLGTGPYLRCPGGSTQPNAGWPAPEDHPFLADGELSGECSPTDVPPGP